MDTSSSRISAIVSVALLAASPAAAQVLRGTVLDNRSGKPVEGVHVVVSTATGTMTRDTVTGATGEFVFQLPTVGDYVLRAGKPGYATKLTEPVNVEPKLEASVVLKLQSSPVRLDTETVVAEKVTVEQQVPYLVDVGFYVRRHKGIGHFLTREDLDKTRSDRITDSFRGISGIHIVCGGQQVCDVQGPAAATTFTRGVCLPSVILDGGVLRTGGVSSEGTPVDQLLNPFNIEGVELYSSPSGVPVQFKGYMSPCGAIIAWSRR